MGSIGSRLEEAKKDKPEGSAPQPRSPAARGYLPGWEGPTLVPTEGVTAALTGPDWSDAKGLRQTLESACPLNSWSPDQSVRQITAEDGLGGRLRDEFRTLRSRLNQARERDHIKRLLITSPLPKDGKTYVAANLAQVMSWHQEHCVLLVDGNLQASRLHACLGGPAAPGLSDYLKGDVDELAIIKRGERSNFFFIPGGHPAPNASELIGNGRLKLLLERLAPAFDWIVIDSPSVLTISDGRLIADLCDCVLMVVRAGRTPFDVAQSAVKAFQGKSFLEIVLNCVDPNDQPFSGRGYSEDGKKR